MPFNNFLIFNFNVKISKSCNEVQRKMPKIVYEIIVLYWLSEIV